MEIGLSNEINFLRKTLYLDRPHSKTFLCFYVFMLSPQGEGPEGKEGEERRGRASSIPGIWILPNLFLPSQVDCGVLQVSRSPEKQARFIKLCIHPAYYKIIIIPFRV